MKIRREVKLTVNEQAVIELSVINTTIGNKTLYQEIKTPDEGCCYTLRVPGQEPAVSVHRPFPPPLSGSLDREAFIQRFVHGRPVALLSARAPVWHLPQGWTAGFHWHHLWKTLHAFIPIHMGSAPAWMYGWLPGWPEGQE